MASIGIQPFLNALDEPAMVVERGIVRFANSAAKELLGASIEGNDIRLVIRNPQALEHILPGQAGDIDITGIGQLGRPWALSVRIVGDQTLLVRLADRSAAIAAEKMRVDFVANASHELRTPLATILGYAETLSEQTVDAPDCMKFGATMRGEAKRMLRIIEDLMSLSRIEAGRFAAPSERVDLGIVLATVVANAEQVAGAAKCRIRLQIEDDLPTIAGDPAQIDQLFDNLVNNAVRYGCKGGNCTIDLTARADDGSVRISVSDTGPGIPREHLPRLTERFYRVDEARSRESGGTGLGLAIAKHIVGRHKGTLTIRSTVGKGTEVVVRLPHDR